MTGCFWGRVFHAAQVLEDTQFDMVLGTSSHRMIEIEPVDLPPLMAPRAKVIVFGGADALIDELFAEIGVSLKKNQQRPCMDPNPLSLRS